MSSTFYIFFEKVFEIVSGSPGGLEGWSDQPQEAQHLPEIVPGAAAGEAQELEQQERRSRWRQAAQHGRQLRECWRAAAYNRNDQQPQELRQFLPELEELRTISSRTAGHDQQLNCVIARLVLFSRLTA